MEQNLINFKEELSGLFHYKKIYEIQQLFEQFNKMNSIVEKYNLDNVLLNLKEISQIQDTLIENEKYVVKTEDEVDIKEFCLDLKRKGFKQINKYYGMIHYAIDKVDLEYSEVLIYCEDTKTFLLCNHYDNIFEMALTLLSY